MKPHIKSLLCMAVACTLSLFAFSTAKSQSIQTISFKWYETSAGSTAFNIQATQGKSFTIDWGDGTPVSTYTGAGTTNVPVAHDYATTFSPHTATISGADATCLFTYLNVGGKNLETLDITKAPSLQDLICNINKLTSLDLSNSTALYSLECSYNNLTHLDLSANTSLQTLNCGTNQLTGLNTSSNTALKSLNCGVNKVTNLDLSENTALDILNCSNNQFTTLDVSKNTVLQTLQCSYNYLTNLDLSRNTALNSLQMVRNNLTYLDVSNNSSLAVISCQENALSLANLYVLSQKITNPKYKFLGVQTLPSKNAALNTPVPLDTVFNGVATTFVVNKNGKPAIADTDYVITGGDIIFKTDAIYTVAISNPGIVSGTPTSVIARFVVGTAEKQYFSFVWTSDKFVQHFTLDASKGKFFTVDWGDGSNPSTHQGTGELKAKAVNHPSHQYRDSNTKYTVTVTAIDPDCFFPQLSLIGKFVSALDITHANTLEALYCGNNQLTALDISKNTVWRLLSCDNNALSLADLYTASRKIADTTCKYLGTQLLPSKTISLNTSVSLDPAFNGVNTVFVVSKFPAAAVAGTDYVISEGNVTFKTAGIYRVEVTNPAITSHAARPAKLIANYVVGGIEKQQISLTWSAADSTRTKKIILQATGGKSFTVNWGDGSSATYIGKGSSAPVSHTYTNTGNYLATVTGVDADCIFSCLNVTGQFVKSLNITQAAALQTLECVRNQLTGLDLSKNNALSHLACSNNELTSLDVSKNVGLKELGCASNQLTSLDLSQNIALERFYSSNNQLTIDVSKNTALTTLECTKNGLYTLNLNKNTALTFLNCGNNYITSLDVSTNTALKILKCATNLLNTLTLGKNTKMNILDCSFNNLQGIDLSNVPAIAMVVCNDNQIRSLDISSNTSLAQLSCPNNKIRKLDISKNSNISTIDWRNNALLLADLYACSKKINTPVFKYLGTQTRTDTAILNVNIDLSKDVLLGTTPSTFTVKQGTVDADGTTYSLINGQLRFLKTGIFTVEMANTAIISNEAAPVKVTVTYIVVDANLQSLSVSQGFLSPAFHSDTSNYTVSVTNSVTSINVTGVASDLAATVTGNVTNKALAIGNNIIPITVTVGNGLTTRVYTVTVVRSDIIINNFTLNNGDAVSPYTTMQLNYNISGTSPTHFIVSEQSDFSDASWKAYDVATNTYTLKDSVHGIRKVYTKLKNNTGETSAMSDEIYYKTAPLKLKLTAFKVSAAPNRMVTLDHVVENGTPVCYSVSEDSATVGKVWLPYKSSPVFKLSEGSGTKKIFFAVSNEAGVSNIVSDKISLTDALQANVYPNPAFTDVNITPEHPSGKFKVTLYDINGKTYFVNKVFQGPSFKIDLSSAPAGVLFIKIVRGNEQVVKKIIKL